MSGWYDALDAQTELANFWRSELGVMYGLSFQASIGQKNGVREGGSAFPIIQDQMVRMADPVWMHPDVMTMVEAAAESFQPEPLIESDLLFPHGFLLLPRTAYLTDFKGKRMGFRAVAWATYHHTDNGAELKPELTPGERPGNGIYVALYSHWDDKDDYITDERERAPFKWALAHVTPWEFGQSLEQATLEPGTAHGSYGVLDQEDCDQLREGHRAVWGLMQVFFRLAQQKVLVNDWRQAPRFSRKRAAREDLDDHIMVVHLRKGMLAPGEGGGDGEAHYSHRFVVRGFWRWQWYPKDKVHRQIWINPYIKGPADAPLIVKDRVGNFVR